MSVNSSRSRARSVRAPRLLLLDEPTANLTAAETARLFGVTRRLIADTELAVLFVSHRMREIRQIADVCTIIRDGKTAVDRVALDAITDREIVECMGQSVEPDGQSSAIADNAAQTHDERDTQASLSVCEGDTITIGREGIAVEIRPGSIVGLAGAPTGPSALITALTGLAVEHAWEVKRNGATVAYTSPSAAARAMASASSRVTGRTRAFSKRCPSLITSSRRSASSSGAAWRTRQKGNRARGFSKR